MKASPKNQAPQMEDLIALTVRVPEILHRRIKKEVEQRRAGGERKLSMADWMIEAARERLDVEGRPVGSQLDRMLAPAVMNGGRKTAAEIAAGLPGVSLGIPNGVPEPVGAEAEEEAWRREFVKEFGPGPLKNMLRMPAMLKLPWPKRFEVARDQRDREAGG